MPASTGAKSAKVTLTPHNQSLEAITKVVAGIIGKSGCRTCGRLINLDFQFQGDPGPELTQEGVVSMHTEGF
ncbi:MAG TPA: hypothetical protein VGR73_14935 [Bryobacteraceae bacterium]|nr:hypothetical protein [Bryobacteraceae bacterium]